MKWKNSVLNMQRLDLEKGIVFRCNRTSLMEKKRLEYCLLVGFSAFF